MTVNTIRTRVRQILDDTYSPYRWENDELRGHIQTAIRRLNVKAPATRYIGPASLVVDYVQLPAGDDAEISVDDRYAEAIALYTAGTAYINDATDTVNAERASSLINRAESLMF